MRARLAIRAAGVPVELREVVLRDKPEAMLALSPKGTVPVLQLADGSVLEESVDIMLWAVANGSAPADLARLSDEQFELVWENDSSFKRALDRYKYADRYPEHSAEYYRDQGEVFLGKLNQQLQAKPYLAGSRQGLVDLAIAPFIRQFAFVDKAWFDAADYPALQSWLQAFLESPLFTSVMEKYPQWQADTQGVSF